MFEKIEFNKFPRIPRFSRDIVITEKIDGTNAQICITEDGQFLTGSRKRWITPEDDNYGFSAWANENKAELIEKLGVGSHYGEWWGRKIQRQYNLKNRCFSLFNTDRWNDKNKPDCVSIVPVLYTGDFDSNAINHALERLKADGSLAAQGFMKPEGIVIYHKKGNIFFKKTLEDDDKGKSRV